MKQLLTGNEAVARGLYEAGCTVAAAYPGTPSTEVLENVAQYKEIQCRWTPNEKVAVEVAGAAAMAGARAFSAQSGPLSAERGAPRRSGRKDSGTDPCRDGSPGSCGHPNPP